MAAARRSAPLRGPDSHPAARPFAEVLDEENVKRKDLVMTMIQACEAVSCDAMPLLIAGLEREFGSECGRVVAELFLAAEDADFHWDSRVAERYLGGYESVEFDADELDRIAIYGRLDGCWFTAIILVDGAGQPHDLIRRAGFGSGEAARQAWANAR